MVARFAIALALLAACHDPPRPESRTQPEPPRDAAVRAWPAGAPARDECRVHEDCAMIVWDGPLPPDPCCDQRVGYLPVARTYLAFMATYRAQSCRGVVCPTPPLPGAEPSCCAGQARCVAKRCVSACDDPTAHVPAVSILDGMCSAGAASAPEPCDAAAIPRAYTGGVASPAHAALTACCASLRASAPLLQYGTPQELTEAAELCEASAARVANECAPGQLAELKKRLRGKGVPRCKLP